MFFCPTVQRVFFYAKRRSKHYHSHFKNIITSFFVLFILYFIFFYHYQKKRTSDFNLYHPKIWTRHVPNPILVLKFWFWISVLTMGFSIWVLILVLRYCKKIDLEKIYPQNSPINYFIVNTFKFTFDTALHKKFFSLNLAYKKYNSTKIKQIFLEKQVSYNY